MKKIFKICIVLVGCVGILSAQKPEKIYSFVKVSKPHEYYIQQAELWWKEIEKNKNNEDAWYNYYRANRYSCATYKGIYGFDGHQNDGWSKESPYLKELDSITRLIEKNIPGTYTDLRLRKCGYPGSDESFKYLEKAYNMRPDDADIYDAMVTYYEMKGNISKRKEFNFKLFNANEISAGFIAYNYNVLMSLKPNGIILTFGDNDTYPLWLIQDALNIRTDVTVLNVPLLADPDYRTLIFKKLGMPSYSKVYTDGATTESGKEITDFIFKNKPASSPLYVGLPAWNQMKEYEKNLYLVGLALEYSTVNIDNTATLINNFENKYALDYIFNRFEYDISAELVVRMNINYMPAIFKLYDHYSLSGDLSHAKKMKDLGLFIAGKCGQDWLNKASELLK